MADRLCTSVRPYKKGQSPIFGYFLPGTSSLSLLTTPPYRKHSCEPFPRPLPLFLKITYGKSLYAILHRTTPTRFYIKRETKLVRNTWLGLSTVSTPSSAVITFLTTTQAAKIVCMTPTLLLPLGVCKAP